VQAVLFSRILEEIKILMWIKAGNGNKYDKTLVKKKIVMEGWEKLNLINRHLIGGYDEYQIQ